MKHVKISLSALGVRKIVAKKHSDKRDEEFLNCLWSYAISSKPWNRTFVSCPFCNKNHSFRTIHNMKKVSECKLVYNYEDTRVKVGNRKMYIISEDEKVLYEVPDLFFHFFVEHKMIPKDFFRKAVIYGVKPGSEKYYEYTKDL